MRLAVIIPIEAVRRNVHPAIVSKSRSEATISTRGEACVGHPSAGHRNNEIMADHQAMRALVQLEAAQHAGDVVEAVLRAVGPNLGALIARDVRESATAVRDRRRLHLLPDLLYCIVG